MITSSPTSPMSGRPSSSHASTAAPRQRAWISPEYTGSTGQPPTKAVQRSVPPLVEKSHRSLLHVLVHPLEALRRQRRAGGAEARSARQVGLPRRLDARLHAGGDEPGAGAEAGDARLLGEAPQPARVRLAVVEHDRGAGQQAAHQEVPHHPAGGGEPEEAVLGREVRCAAASSSGARAGCRPGPGRSPWAARWCPTSRGPTAGGRTAPARTGARPARPGARPSPTAPSRCARATGSPPRSRARARRGRSPCRRSGSRPWRAAPWARSARSGRSPWAPRTPARSSTRWRRCSPWPAAPPPPRARSAGRPPRGRRAPLRACAGRRRSAPPGRSSSSQLTSAGAPPSSAWTMRRRARARHAQHVLGVVEPGAREPVGAGHLPCRRARARRAAEASTSKRSQSEPQKPSRSSTDQRQSSS